jgi:hypothetical protein
MRTIETVEQPAKPAAKSKPAKTNGGSKPNGHGNRLTAAERNRLEKYEATIQSHFESFRLAGEALQNIRDSRLYRETHATFEDYCREKWEMSKTQANRLIAAAKVVENISSVAPKEVTEHLTESVIRALATLDPKDQKKAFKQAVKDAPASTGVTAKIVTKAAHEVAPARFKKPATSTARKGTSDLIRRTELLDEINAWEREQRSSKKFEALSPRQVITAVRQIIKGL